MLFESVINAEINVRLESRISRGHFTLLGFKIKTGAIHACLDRWLRLYLGRCIHIPVYGILFNYSKDIAIMGQCGGGHGETVNISEYP